MADIRAKTSRGNYRKSKVKKDNEFSECDIIHNDQFYHQIYFTNEVSFMNSENSLNGSDKTSFLKKIKLLFSKKNELKYEKKNSDISTTTVRKCIEDGIIIPHLLNSHCPTNSFYTNSDCNIQNGHNPNDIIEKSHPNQRSEEKRSGDNEFNNNEAAKEEGTQTLISSADIGIQAIEPNDSSSNCNKSEKLNVPLLYKPSKHNADTQSSFKSHKFKSRKWKSIYNSNIKIINKENESKFSPVEVNQESIMSKTVKSNEKNIQKRIMNDDNQLITKNNHKTQLDLFGMNQTVNGGRSKQIEKEAKHKKQYCDPRSLPKKIELNSKKCRSIHSSGENFSEHSSTYMHNGEFESVTSYENSCSFEERNPKTRSYRAKIKKPQAKEETNSNHSQNLTKSSDYKSNIADSDQLRSEKSYVAENYHKIKKMPNEKINSSKYKQKKLHDGKLVQTTLGQEGISSPLNTFSETSIYKSTSTTCFSSHKQNLSSLQSCTTGHSNKTNAIKPTIEEIHSYFEPDMAHNSEGSEQKKPKQNIPENYRQPIITSPNHSLSHRVQSPYELAWSGITMDKQSSEILGSTKFDYITPSYMSEDNQGVTSESIENPHSMKKIQAVDNSGRVTTSNEILFKQKKKANLDREQEYKKQLKEIRKKLKGKFNEECKNLIRKNDFKQKLHMIKNDSSILKLSESDTGSCMNISVQQFEALMNNKCVTLRSNTMYNRDNFIRAFTFQEQDLSKVDNSNTRIMREEFPMANFSPFLDIRPSCQQYTPNSAANINNQRLCNNLEPEGNSNLKFNVVNKTKKNTVIKNNYAPRNEQQGLSSSIQLSSKIQTEDHFSPLIGTNYTRKICSKNSRHKQVIGEEKFKSAEESKDSVKELDHRAQALIYGTFSGNISPTTNKN